MKLALALLLVSFSTVASPWRVGYFNSPTIATYGVALIPFGKYTHIVNFYGQLASDCSLDNTTSLESTSRDTLISTGHAFGVKVLYGLVQNSYIVPCTTAGNVNAVATAIANYVTTYGYDGVDLDWESGIVTTQYQALITAIRAALPTAIFTVDATIDHRTDVQPVIGSVDAINAESYNLDIGDYLGGALTFCWFNNALWAHGNLATVQTAEGNVDYFLSAGIPASKILLGISFYAISRTACTSPGVPFGGGSSTRTQINYSDAYAALKNPSVYAYHFDYFVGVPWLYGNGLLISYTDERYLQLAAQLAKQLSLAGIATFALHQEYLSQFSGDLRYPLSSALYSVLH